MKSLVIVIYNPAARRASEKKIARAIEYLKEKGFAVDLLRTERAGHARQLAAAAGKRAPRLIMAAGGDGTVNEVINGIARTDTPLGVLPLGTTNVLAKELEIPEDICGAVETAVTSSPKKVSLGMIETGSGRDYAARFFCLMAGIGLDGKAVYDVNAALKKISGKAAYIFSGIRNIMGYSPEKLSITVDGKEYSCYSAVIGKASKYGGNFKVTPDASLLDPFLFVCLFQGGRRRDLLRYAIGVIRGKHLAYRDVIYLKAFEVEVRGNAHIQIDGDYLGPTPAKISAVRDVLTLAYGGRR